MEPPRNRCLTDASTIELPDGSILECGARRPPQTFSVLPRMGQSSTDPFAQNLALELGEHSQQSGHGSPEGRSQVQRLGQRYEPDAESSSSCSVASRSVTDRPQRSKRHTNTTSISRRRAASSSFSRISRWEAPDPTSFTCNATVQPRRAVYSRRARFCRGRVCWSWVDTRAYKPARTILAGFRAWPKTLCDFALPEVRLAAMARGPIRQAGTYSFRPGGFILLQPAPRSGGSSRASTRPGGPPVPVRAAVTRSGSQTSWRHTGRPCESGS